ncbi:MAG: hypothetical protein RBR30_02680 [Tenuifilaceae bacterium]|jgi:predicted class III extradiol MEMO1 family dioxygenase|nr:hypothetical protein [Tenuifilaceae bacterium]
MPFGAIMVSKTIMEQNHITIEDDDVRSAIVAKANFIHYSPEERQSPLDRIKQTIVRHVGLNEPQIYYVYDVGYLNGHGFPVGQEVYIIWDGKAFPVCVDGAEYETITRTDELAEDMSTAIQNEQSVNLHHLNSYIQKVSRLSYKIDMEIIEKINAADTVLLRYYADPNPITVQFNEFHLDRPKKLINTPLNQ